MSAHDAWLNEGSEGDPWSEGWDEVPRCEFCETFMEERDGLQFCPECSPCLTEEYIPVRASFEVVEGKVREL